MRKLTAHRVEVLGDDEKPIQFKPGAANDLIAIEAGDDIKDSAPATYTFFIKDARGVEWNKLPSLRFHQGPLLGTNVDGSVKKNPLTGVTNEALLAIVLDRLECFQKGKHACKWNGLAIQNVKDALEHLKARSLERHKAGVEGTDAK